MAGRVSLPPKLKRVGMRLELSPAAQQQLSKLSDRLALEPSQVLDALLRSELEFEAAILVRIAADAAGTVVWRHEELASEVRRRQPRKTTSK